MVSGPNGVKYSLPMSELWRYWTLDLNSEASRSSHTVYLGTATTMSCQLKYNHSDRLRKHSVCIKCNTKNEPHICYYSLQDRSGLPKYMKHLHLKCDNRSRDFPFPGNIWNQSLFGTEKVYESVSENFGTEKSRYIGLWNIWSRDFPTWAFQTLSPFVFFPHIYK